MNYGIAVISKGRPEAVTRMAEHLAGFTPRWFVPEDEVAAYEAAGAAAVSPDGGSLCAARNFALSRAFERGIACVQVSDDLRKLKALPQQEVSLGWVLTELDRALDETGLILAGVAPTNNLYFAKDGVSTRKFVIGDLIMVRPTDLRFDKSLRLKEDYDFTLQNWATYGGAARCDYIAPDFAHYRNAGGAVAVRTADLEQQTIFYLKAKWGTGLIRDNPRRPNEILFATPRRVK